MTPAEAYDYAIKNHTKPGFDLDYYQQICCKLSVYAYSFALHIPGANIEYCQEHACKTINVAYWFAEYVPGADIEYCRKEIEKVCGLNKECLDEFDKMIINKAMS